MTDGSLPRSYFEQLYAGDADPWRFATSDYEKRKYARSMAALARARYGAGLEIGCSIGVMTLQLAQRCETLLAVDIAAAPLTVARRRCAGMPSVRFERMNVPRDWPDGTFDLIVLSEVVYYLDEEDVAFLARRIEETLVRGGDVLLVHWTGRTDYPLSGDRAAELLIEKISSFAQVLIQDRTQKFRLDLLRRS